MLGERVYNYGWDIDKWWRYVLCYVCWVFDILRLVGVIVYVVGGRWKRIYRIEGNIGVYFGE